MRKLFTSEDLNVFAMTEVDRCKDCIIEKTEKNRDKYF